MKDIIDSSIIDPIVDYIIKKEKETIQNFIQSNESNLLVLKISGFFILNISSKLSLTIFNDWFKFNEIMEECSCSILRKVSNELNVNVNNCKLIKFRIFELPLFPELMYISLPQINDYGKFLILKGKVIGISKVKQMFYSRKYLCDLCNFTFCTKIDIQKPNNYNKPPKSCPSPSECNSINFTHVNDLCTDFQEIVLQELSETVNHKGMMNNITVFLQDDLIEKCRPGDTVVVYGTVLVRFKSLVPKSFMESQLFILANNLFTENFKNAITNVEFTDEEYSSFWAHHKSQNTLMYARDEIVNSLCPKLFGLNVSKLSILLAIIGGTQIIDPANGVKQRGLSHVLLIGDPGTGKSQLLKQACKVVPKSIFTSGTGTTSAGLTASVVKEAGCTHWNLEAGALPSVSNGICCIDEFNSLKKSDKISIHEAMEQQTISVAKAGIICHLTTQMSIIAACNIKNNGNYHENQSLSDNIGIAPPLLSRFDLVIFIKDSLDNPLIDERIADFILKDTNETISSYPDKSRNLLSFPWSIETLSSYVSTVKELKPILTIDSSNILKKYYQSCRLNNVRDTARTTIRLLESLTRLATAHAKLMYHTEVTIEDTLAAIILMNESLESIENYTSTKPSTTYRIIDIDKDFYEKCTKVLDSIGMSEYKDRLSSKNNNNEPRIIDDSEIMSILNITSNNAKKKNENNNYTQNVKKEKNIIDSEFNFDLNDDIINCPEEPNDVKNPLISGKRSFLTTLKNFKKE